MHLSTARTFPFLQNITLEISDTRTDSRASVVSMESQEVANINANQLAQFRSYTGNSPADLHGMWYPTVKRTLVCLSRLYFCLDRQTFQGLAQEALAICVQTIESATSQIIARKVSFHFESMAFFLMETIVGFVG